jgi:F420-dependent oxidoreductase-like protein
MRLGMTLDYRSDFREMVDELVDYERAGLDVVFVPEAYGFDAVSQLGYLAARTDRVQLASGVLPIYSRTPALLAMTAAGLDHVSDGRFTLGLGSSGPQVVEGLHGVRFEGPVERTREIIELCRKAWRLEPIAHTGRYVNVPLPGGAGKPLKLINTPLRQHIPIVVGAVGVRNVEMAAEVADGWKPMFFLPERADDIWGGALRRGAQRRDQTLGTLDVVAQATVAIGDDPQVRALAAERVRALVALYVGGMGSPERNFYHRLVTRYGYEGEAQQIQRLFVSGPPSHRIGGLASNSSRPYAP